MGKKGGREDMNNKRQEIKDVMAYKDGSYCVGSLAFSHVCALLGCDYPTMNFNKAVDEASKREIDEVHSYLTNYITHMIKNPKKRCPTCGQYT